MISPFSTEEQTASVAQMMRWLVIYDSLYHPHPPAQILFFNQCNSSLLFSSLELGAAYINDAAVRRLNVRYANETGVALNYWPHCTHSHPDADTLAKAVVHYSSDTVNDFS